MTEQEFLTKIRAILDDETITMNTVLANVEDWDSLNFIKYSAMAKSSCGKNILPAHIRTCKTIGDLYNLLSVE